MRRRMRRVLIVLHLALLCLFPLAGRALGKGELSTKDARNLIRRLAGSDLPSGAVRIRTITSTGSAEAVALAQIETAFRFEQDDNDRWRIAEIRTGDNRWEDLELFARAAAGETSLGAPAEASMIQRARASLDALFARELLASLLGVELPSDAVRVKEVSSLYKSAVAVAQVAAEFRFNKGSDGKWRIVQLRTGTREWTDVERMIRVVNDEKARLARSELEMMAAALNSFKRERGFYVIADSTGTLVDQLNPRYLRRVIRLDPWHRPYLYEGERDHYVLRSAGADGEVGTADDINVPRTVGSQDR
ncbi:MAG TPA: type II secretion system protein GspG [Pyrinomonadaceae bacterium]|nr:type II secretion system protein GspG [Pyrinomonadaceae bacterium]